MADKGIDGISHWRRILLGFEVGNLGSLQTLECPMWAILGSLLDPAFEQLDLLLGELPDLCFRRRHDIIRIISGDSPDHFALVWRSWDYFPTTSCTFKGVDPEFAFAVVFVWAMAVEALVRDDRADFPVEIDRLFFCNRWGKADNQQSNSCRNGAKSGHFGWNVHAEGSPDPRQNSGQGRNGANVPELRGFFAQSTNGDAVWADSSGLPSIGAVSDLRVPGCGDQAVGSEVEFGGASERDEAF